MREPIEYDDFPLHFESASGQPGTYRVWRLPMDAGSVATAFDATPFDLRLGALARATRAENGGQARDVRRRYHDDIGIDLRDLGSQLFVALFQEPLLTAFADARRTAAEGGRGLRLRLVVDPELGEPSLELLGLPWEWLYDPAAGDFLSHDPRTAIVRHVRNPAQPLPGLDLLGGPLRILTIAPAPRGLDPLDAAGEAEQLADALARRGRLAICPLVPPTLSTLRRAVRDFDPHVIHFGGHGTFGDRHGSALCFEREDGGVDEVPPERVAEALLGAPSLQLAVFNACDSGHLPSNPPEIAAALALLRRLPAVVAMQLPISDRAAIAFAGAFYDALAASDPLEAAVAEGRQAIHNELGNREGSVAALYLRRHTGQLFRLVARWELAPWLRPQDDLVNDLTRHFVGRSFVFERIDAFLANDQRRGYFLLRGDPGIGKSALLAEWIRRRHAVYHFNVRNDSSCNRTCHFLGNVCAQLILRYRLPYPTLPDGATDGSQFLQQLLREIAQHHRDAGEPLLIAVDALDEVVDGGSRGGNFLDLPVRLPENVFFVLTTRRPPADDGGPRLRFEVAMDDLNLKHDATANQADVRAFIELGDEKRHPAIALESWWRARGLDRAAFVELLAARSEGNFRYLFHVLPEIANGKYRDEGVDSLPLGLLSYYRDHWQRLRHLCGKDWRTYQLPVLAALSVVAHPLELEIVRYLTRIDSALEVLAVLLAWEAFLHVSPHPSRQVQLQTYRFYHATFIEFVEAQPEVGLVAFEKKMKEQLLADFELYDRAEPSADASSLGDDGER